MKADFDAQKFDIAIRSRRRGIDAVKIRAVILKFDHQLHPVMFMLSDKLSNHLRVGGLLPCVCAAVVSPSFHYDVFRIRPPQTVLPPHVRARDLAA